MAQGMNREPELKDYLPGCYGQRQVDLLYALERNQWILSRAAKELDMDPAYARREWKKLQARAAQGGVAPREGFAPSVVPEGFGLTKSTVHVTAAGTVQRWDRVAADKKAAEEAALNAIRDAADGLTAAPSVKAPRNTLKDLLTCYVLTDFHLGMYAWAQEGGADWSLPDAREVLWNCFGDMIQRSPNSETAILCNLGDFLHWDGLLALTPAHQHVLDADTRYDKLAGLALDLMCWMVDTLLIHHKKVLVIAAEGNHDEAGSVWLRQALRKIYEKSKRVTVDCNPLPYYGVLHGDILLGFHHGHKTKDRQLRDVFAGDPKFRGMWGSARQTFLHCGHLHNQAKAEDGGAVIERHPTLSARDAYAARGGWQSHRCAHAITYHKTRGEVSRVTVVPPEPAEDEAA